MGQPTDSDTRATDSSLIRDAGDLDDQAAWNRFFQQYWRFIIFLALKRHRCNDAMADDVMQETMMVLMRRLPTFRYDRTRGRFRDFLACIVRFNSLRAHRRERLKDRAFVDSGDSRDLIAELPDTDTATSGEAGDWDFYLFLLGIGMERVRARVDATTFASYWLTVKEGMSPAAVAAKLGISVNSVYVNKNRVRRMLEEELRKLREEYGDD